MKVAELVSLLLKQPQDAEVYIHDADEECLLKLDKHVVRYEKGDRNYPFPRVELGQDYGYGDETNRVRMADWCPRCEFPEHYSGHTCGKTE